MSLSQLVATMSAKTDGRLGYTTTVKDQVDSIEGNMDHYKRVLESQRKQQGELQFEIKKLEEQTKTSFQELHKEISERVQYLNDLLRSDNAAQNKQFQYLQMQNSHLHEEHEKMNELSSIIGSRTQEVQNNVGL